MKTLRKNGGFTLVELIVVIAILAILAGVAVPAYSGYIKKANTAADITTLGAVKTAAMAATATEGAVSSLTVTEGAPDTSVKGKVGAETTEKTIDISDFFENDIDLETGSSATWNGSEWTIN